jgi:methionyl-tRNA formyltransferase
MKISILCSSQKHPVNIWLDNWIEQYGNIHEISLFRKKEELIGGDILFLISCNEIINRSDRNMYLKTLVIHASDLPLGRGWSPHVWSILQGENEIVVTLLEAEDKVDSGDIWKKNRLAISPDALHHEINELLFCEEINLMTFAIENFNKITPVPQDPEISPTFFPLRTPKESEINPAQSIEEQFNLIRISDPERYPAFFKLHGHVYKIKLEKMTDGQ